MTIAICKYGKLAVGIVIAALLAFAFAKTYQHGYEVAAARGDKALADYRATVEHTSASAASEAFGRYAADVARASAAESGYLTAQTTVARNATVLKERIDHVAQPHRNPPVPGQQPDSPDAGCVFSRGFVRVWNDAASIADAGDSAMPTSADPAAAVVGPDADAAADSGVSQADILDWFVDYATHARNTESKLKVVKATLTKQEDKQ
ncbi:hypothetical protein [Burkholderia pseudomallei]|uniref:hypothetical protein n=1 Tax=Burkholderia pseudomallei TaxID=28450 RepID=UPI0005310368|nr:hypothetical protein [Burkholderia pseudomallei]KGX76400.1 hypothetical protein Y033_2080 [Burkholderia pseudomallei MSHR435]AJX21574.1 hypothetical protein BG17_700 [Burkholderia pseudomallei MSHR491]AJX76390.1 hypothetical protein BG16_2029 [Burkholderia pseudomallei MSHR2543]KGS74483.1 hypothetical protein X942_5464 [Burkholderia pseudomallei MSHR5596]KGW87708.1 hypothetical protein Y048_3287 [Burkholderia pseudomallei MSHR456]